MKTRFDIENHSNGCLASNLNIDLMIRNVPRPPQWGQEILGKDDNIVTPGQTAYTVFTLRKFNVLIRKMGDIGKDCFLPFEKVLDIVEETSSFQFNIK